MGSRSVGFAEGGDASLWTVSGFGRNDGAQTTYVRHASLFDRVTSRYETAIPCLEVRRRSWNRKCGEAVAVHFACLRQQLAKGHRLLIEPK